MINRILDALEFQGHPDAYFDPEAERDDAEYINDYLLRVPEGHEVSITIGPGGLVTRGPIEIPSHISNLWVTGGGQEGRVSIAHWLPRNRK